MTVCGPCGEQLTKWFDFRGRAALGIQMQVIGNGTGNFPCWVNTRAVVNKNVKSIREACAANHRSAA